MNTRIVIVVGFGTVLLAFSGATVVASEPTESATAIDVSHHSGVIDWEQVAAQQVGVVYLKATEGVEDAEVPGIEKGADRSRLHPDVDVLKIVVQPVPPAP